jgi:Right handed beta helix region
MALFFLTFSAGVAEAQTYTVSHTGSNDQDVINQAISQAQPGDTVFLTTGVYDLTGTVILKSDMILTGDPNAVLKVSSSSSQWFTGATGIISCKESLKNVEVCGFQIDGNLGALPASYANTPGHNKDCERCILIGGDSGNYADNIKIHDMKLYNSFSDGIYLKFAKNSACYNNFISNCQHEGIFWSCVENSQMYGNQIAAITSDAARLDNCVNCKVYDNVFFSYDGDDTNGAYKHGDNGLQVGDAGSSHGYDAHNKPTTTTNIEIFNNTFANNGLKAIALGSNSDNNVYIHDNKFIGVAELETMGISVKGISASNPPTVQQSEKIFSSIFDILNTTLSDSGYVQQSSVFSPDKTLMSKGTESAWIDVMGYTGQIKIGNDTYIPKPANECAIVLSGTQSTRDNVVRQEASKKLSEGSDNNLTVDLEVKTTYEVPEKNKITILGKSINYTSQKKKSENTTFSKTFKAPLLFPAFNPPNVSVINFNGSHVIVSVPKLPGIVKIDYTYNNSTATEYRLIGYVGSATNGFKSTEYETTVNYLFDSNGKMSRSPNGLYITEKNFDLSKLNVTVVTPYDNFHISHFEYVVIEDDHLKFFKWGFVGILGYFFIFGRAIHKIIFSVVGKWI